MRKNKVFFILVILLFISSITSCRSRSIALPGFLAANTPTHTATNTSTPIPPYRTFTPTNTPAATDTPTPTPTPPVGLQPCSFAENCPEAINILELIDEEVLTGDVVEVEVPYNIPLLFYSRWTATDEETLEQNMKVMEVFFDLDGQSYLIDSDIATGFVADENDSTREYPFVAFGYVLDDWQIDEPHVVHIGFRFLEEVFDGWDTYPAGTTYERTYVINPVPLPTATPTATATNTPLPVPTQIPATATPACEASGSIEIINDTGGQVIMYLSGPVKYTFYIAAGSRTLNVCPGEYSYTAYGCGGASINGTASDGDEIEFWCE